jgi:hypothetical protein
VSEGTPLTNETELLAWAVLRAANTTQARGTTIRLVVPRAPDVAHDLDIEVPEERILEAEEWLVKRGYLAPTNVGLTWGTYTITPAGLEWLRGGMPEPLDAPQQATEDAPGPKKLPSGGADAPAASERVPWWRRMLGF